MILPDSEISHIDFHQLQRLQVKLTNEIDLKRKDAIRDKLTSKMPLYRGMRSRSPVNSRIFSSRTGEQSRAMREIIYCE